MFKQVCNPNPGPIDGEYDVAFDSGYTDAAIAQMQADAKFLWDRCDIACHDSGRELYYKLYMPRMTPDEYEALEKLAMGTCRHATVKFCGECGKYPAEEGSSKCLGCMAYREHQSV